MAGFDINSIIITGTLFVIFGVFLFFDLFKRNERYGYLAYIVALVPINFLWFLQFDVLGVYLILFILWNLCLLRDLFGVARTKDPKQINDIVLYLVLGIIIQIIITAILPVSIISMQTNTIPYGFFYFPDIYTGAFGIELWVNPTILLVFRITASVLIGLVIVPLLVDLRDEEVPLPVFIIIIGLFILPFLYLSYIWLPIAMGVLTFLMSVILFIVLLIITKSGKEGQKKK
ncbi:MAG TPA: hypothetical protein VMV43_10215 [Candidatus Nanopelagicaceae bacterium]|nr:hypothetical protein [Candidatus Nanopelagicaceae bacterium]